MLPLYGVHGASPVWFVSGTAFEQVDFWHQGLPCEPLKDAAGINPAVRIPKRTKSGENASHIKVPTS